VGRKKKFPPSIYNDKGYAWFRLDGQAYYIGKHGSTAAQKKYAEIIEAYLYPQGRAPEPRPTDLTVAEALLLYWRFVKDQHDPRQVSRIGFALEPLFDLYGPSLVKDFGPVALEAVQEALVAKSYARKYVNQLLVLIRQAFKWLARKEWIRVEQYESLRTVEGLRAGRTKAHETVPRLPVNLEHVEPIFPHLTRPIAAMIRFQQLTAARPGEVCSLRPCDVDRAWRVVEGTAIWLYSPGRYELDRALPPVVSHKGEWRGHSREIPLGPKAQELLLPFLENRDPLAFCFSPREAVIESYGAKGWKVVLKRKRPPGLRYSITSYCHAIHVACDKARVPRWSPNQLRKRVATDIRAELGLDAASCILGHARPDTTAHYYAAKLDTAAKLAAERG
jgi:integrase